MHLLDRLRAAANRVTARLTLVGADPHDDEDLRARKALLVLISVLILPVAGLWGALYLAFGSPVGVVPLVYFGVLLCAIAVFARTRDFPWLLRVGQVDILLAPAEVVGYLDHLFSHFDELAERYGLEKIKTIGDCYMVAAGVPTPRPDHARALALMALDMLDAMRSNAEVAHLAALDHPERVASLTLISTSAGPGDPDLPGMSNELRARFAAPPPAPDWSDRQAVIEYIVEDARAYAATSRPFDEAPWRTLAGRDFDRSLNIASSMTNHLLADAAGRWRERLGEIRAPTLIIPSDEEP